MNWGTLLLSGIAFFLAWTLRVDSWRWLPSLLVGITLLFMAFIGYRKNE